MKRTLPPPVSGGELMKQFPPRPSAIEGRYVVLRDESGQPYNVPLSRMESEADVISWIRHLVEKSWVTVDHIADLIDAAKANGIK